MNVIRVPMNQGWMVEWLTGETIVTSKGKVLKMKDCYESTSKEKVEAKAKELTQNGFTVTGIYECIF